MSRVLRVGSVLVLILHISVLAYAEDRALKAQLDMMRSEKRVALVIGNSNYASSPLKNPVNDARLMAETLRGLGFDVITLENGTLRQMTEKVSEFGKQIRGGGVGLFYYAGHGIQVGGNNYLVPIGANIEVEGDVPLESMDVARVLTRMDEAGNRLNIAILDACRNNPYSRSFRSADKGLATLDAPKGTFIAYATAPGSVAADGEGSNNGVFTAELAKAMRSEGVEIDMMFRQVRGGVMKVTGDRQVPWTSSSLVGQFYFNVPAEASVPSPSVDPESELWAVIKDSTDPADFRDFLTSYPDGKLSEAARKMLKRLEGAAIIPTMPPTPVKPSMPAEQAAPSAPTQETGDGMVFVPGGCFQMGDNFGDGVKEEKPVHMVCLSDYYIGKYEVTQKQWREVMGDNPSRFSSCGDACPVDKVNWNDAQEFIGKLNAKTGETYRLPTEAEWEYAARSGGKMERYAGTDSYVGGVAWYAGNSDGKTHPVGQKDPNGLGIYDMSGNVWEWCADCYGKYGRDNQNDPVGQCGRTDRVLRGGSWYDGSMIVRASSRAKSSPDYRDFYLGLRLARSK